LCNLLEFRFFLDELQGDKQRFKADEETWLRAKTALNNHFEKSTKLDTCRRIIEEFEEIHPDQKYISDFISFVGESKLEDFYDSSGSSIIVSTIHKAKGKEFDNVVILLDDRFSFFDEERLLYVALTRARNRLEIHTNGNCFDETDAEGIERIEDSNAYPAPDFLSMQLGLQDVWLDFSIYQQNAISELVSGDHLAADKEGCSNERGARVLKFSSSFKNKIQACEQKGYALKEAKVDFVVFWKKKGTEEEARMILPELVFKKSEEDFVRR
jgi:ATP-dependent DNA helicase RecQ